GGNGGEPDLFTGPTLEAPIGPPGPDKGLLGRVLRLASVPQEEKALPQDAVSVFPHPPLCHLRWSRPRLYPLHEPPTPFTLLDTSSRHSVSFLGKKARRFRGGLRALGDHWAPVVASSFLRPKRFFRRVPSTRSPRMRR